MSLWNDFVEQARRDYRLGNGREEDLRPLVAAIVFVASVAVAIVTAPLVIGPWL